MTIPFLPLLSKIGLHVIGFEDLSAVKLSGEMNAVKADVEFNLAKIGEVNLVKFENSVLAVMNASDEQLKILKSRVGEGVDQPRFDDVAAQIERDTVADIRLRK